MPRGRSTGDRYTPRRPPKTRKIPKNPKKPDFHFVPTGRVIKYPPKCTPPGPRGAPPGVQGAPRRHPRCPFPSRGPGVPPRPGASRVEFRLHGVRLLQSSQLAHVWVRDSCSAISSPRSRYLAWKGVNPFPADSNPQGVCADRRLRLWLFLVTHRWCVSLRGEADGVGIPPRFTDDPPGSPPRCSPTSALGAGRPAERWLGSRAGHPPAGGPRPRRTGGVPGPPGGSPPGAPETPPRDPDPRGPKWPKNGPFFDPCGAKS